MSRKPGLSLLVILLSLLLLAGCSTTGEGEAYDHPVSPYYRHPDFHSLKSDDTLTILTGFGTYQQTADYTCAPACVLMVLGWYGEEDLGEMEIAELLGSRENTGTAAEDVSDFFRSIGWSVEDNTGKEPIHTEADFRDFIITNLENGYPVIVDWLEWGGHYVVIIGYDTMGTEAIEDDVMILADPADLTDHLQDGYFITSAQMFFYMWREGSGHDGKAPQRQIYIIAHPNA